MKRRKFLLTSGTALLGSTAITGSRQPVIGVEFDISADITADPSTVDSILVDFTNFELLPQYVDETAGNATITITLNVENQNTVQYSTEQQLTNGQKVTKSDINSIIPLVVDGIDTTSSIDGEVRIEVEHPSVSDSYRQTFSVYEGLLTEGLAGWWPLNEESGTSVGDAVGSQSGISNSVTKNVLGRSGITSYSFDQNKSYVDLGSPIELSPNDPYSVSVWFRTRNISKSKQSIIEGSDGSVSLVQLFLNEGNVENRHFDGASGNTVSPVPVTEHSWNHAVLVYDGSDLNLYVNGSLAGSKTVSDLDSSADKWWVGVSDLENSSEAYFNGYIGNVRIYSRSISGSEVDTLYSIGVGDETNNSLHNGTGYDASMRWNFDSNLSDSWNSYQLSGTAGFRSNTVRRTRKEPSYTEKFSSFDTEDWTLIDDAIYQSSNNRVKLNDGSSTAGTVIYEPGLPYNSWVSDFEFRIGESGADYISMRFDGQSRDYSDFHYARFNHYRNQIELANTDVGVIKKVDRNLGSGNYRAQVCYSNSTVSIILNGTSILTEKITPFGNPGVSFRGWSGGVSGRHYLNNVRYNPTNSIYLRPSNSLSFSVPNSQATDTCTVSFFVNPLSQVDPNPGIIERISDSGDKLFQFNKTDNAYNGEVELFTQTSGLLSNHPLRENAWTHIAATLGNQKDKLYINGSLVDEEQSGSLSEISGDLLIGNRSDTGDRYNGYIDDLRIYNRELSEEQIYDLYRWASLGRNLRDDL